MKYFTYTQIKILRKYLFCFLFYNSRKFLTTVKGTNKDRFKQFLYTF